MPKLQPVETSLVIGDTHNAPGQDTEHFKALNKLLKARFISRIIIMGDWVDMESLNRFDTIGSKAGEGRRIEADIKSGEIALNALLQGIPPIDVIFLEGNHEERIGRMCEEHPKLDGSFALQGRFGDCVRSRGGGFTFIPYRDYYLHPSGLAFTHVPHNAYKPIESATGARKVLSLSATSVIWGHTHQLDFATLKRNGGSQLYGLNVGCFIRPEYDPKYMKGKIKDWWRGVVLVKHNGKEWRGEYETVSLASLKSI